MKASLSVNERSTIETGGWGWPGQMGVSSRKAHYFPAGSPDALCGKWGWYYGPRFDNKHDSIDNCAECKRRRAALKTDGSRR